MKYYFRLLWLVLTQHRRSRCSMFGPCVSHFRVWPNDLDMFMHVNNGAYLTLADLGRLDLLLRSGTFQPIRKRGWYPVVSAETIQFRRSLKLFDRYTITTRVLGWNDQKTYIEQVFEKPEKDGSQFIARALIEARFLSTQGEKVAIGELLELVHEAGDEAQAEQSPPLPEWAETWLSSMALMRQGESGSSATPVQK